MIKRNVLIGLLIFLGVYALAGNAYAAIFKWDRNLDGTTGYKIYYSSDEGVYNNHIDVGNITEYSIDLLPLLEKVKYYIVVTAYNSEYESDFSDYKVYTLDDSTPPLPPIINNID